MNPSELGQVLSDSAAEVLESMFFTGVAGEAPAEAIPADAAIWASLRFLGSPSGAFGVGLPRDAARRIAASFLGTETSEVSDTQTDEVICELANMLCGSVLSRVEGNARFDLSQPRPAAAPADSGSPGARKTLLTEEGPLAVWVELEPEG
jgi:hypothetical protein